MTCAMLIISISILKIFIHEGPTMHCMTPNYPPSTPWHTVCMRVLGGENCSRTSCLGTAH